MVVAAVTSLLVAAGGGPLAWRHWDGHYPVLYVLAAAVTIAAIAGVPYARSRSLPVSAVIGVGTGSLLLAAAVFSLISVV